MVIHPGVLGRTETASTLHSHQNRLIALAGKVLILAAAKPYSPCATIADESVNLKLQRTVPYGAENPRSGLFGRLYAHRADYILKTPAATRGAFLPVLVMLADRFRQFETISTFLALEFVDRHGQSSRRRAVDVIELQGKASSSASIDWKIRVVDRVVQPPSGSAAALPLPAPDTSGPIYIENSAVFP